MINMIFYVLIIIFLFCLKETFGKDPKLYWSQELWDSQWKSGNWDYMDVVPVERARLAIVGEVFIPSYSSRNSSILDVGCASGTLLDFLSPRQKSLYHGIDLSKQAIDKARTTRPRGKFEVAVAHEFQPKQKYDVIVFSEVLYYTDYEALALQYENYLTPNGIFISSIFSKNENEPTPKKIFSFFESRYQVLDNLQVVGFTKIKKDSKPDRVMSLIQVVRRRT
jgi:2-polyprenyl-3-methyl-5-hydroxy-6-metoxy-1,4-benzoquinol methylase